jgi:L-galactose dehydrogenase
MEYNILGNTGLRVSELAFGASSIGGMFESVDENEALKTIHQAFDRGINYFDTSPAYGRETSPYGATTSETILGKGLKELKRSEFVLSTKAGKISSLPPELNFSYSHIVQSVESSLKRLQVDHIDILILHDIEYDRGKHLDMALTQGLDALQDLKKQGKIKHFGVSCYSVPVIEKVIQDYNLDAILVHNHYTLIDDKLSGLLPKIQSKGIGLISASPFASGLLTSQGPPDWYPISQEELNVVGKANDWCKDNNVAMEKLALQYALSCSGIPTTLFSCTTRQLVDQNVNWSEEPINLAMVQELKTLLKPIQNKDFDFGGYNK